MPGLSGTQRAHWRPRCPSRANRHRSSLVEICCLASDRPSQQHGLGVLDVALERLQELRADRAVDHAVVRAERHVHDARGLELACASTAGPQHVVRTSAQQRALRTRLARRHDARLGGAHRQNASLHHTNRKRASLRKTPPRERAHLRRVDDRRKVLHAKHAQVGNRERAALRANAIRFQPSLPCSTDKRLPPTWYSAGASLPARAFAASAFMSPLMSERKTNTHKFTNPHLTRNQKMAYW